MHVAFNEIKVLSIEDNEGDTLLIDDYLKEEFVDPKIIFVKSFAEAKLQFGKQDNFDIILLDLSLPDYDRKSLVENIIDNAGNTPVIILTGYADREFGVQTLSLGVSDYLFKDRLTAAQLFKSIVYSIERKKNIISLKEKNDLLSKLTNTVPIVIYQFEISVDGKMTFPFISEAIKKLTQNVNIEDLKNDATLIFANVHHDDLIKFLESIVESKVNLTEWAVEFRILKENNEIIWVKGISQPELKENGTVVWYGFLEDITAVKTSAEQLLMKNNELQKTNEELDRFVYSASHDLRSPLASILGIVNIAELSDTKLELNDALGRIKSNVKRLDDFIQDILNYSKNSRVKVENELLNWKLLVEETIDQLNFMVEASKISIEMEINDGFSFYGDEIRLKIILSNLIANAIKYQQPEKKNKRVSIKVNVQPDIVEIIIEDNGIGIDSKYKDRIFDMFFRASKGSTGTGIGLYIVKEAISKLNGTIQLETEVNTGSRFAITIPNKLIA